MFYFKHFVVEFFVRLIIIIHNKILDKDGHAADVPR